MIFTPEELAEIHAYHRAHYIWAAVGDFVNFGVAMAMLRYVVAPLYARCERVKPPSSKILARLWKGDGWAAALLFAFAYFAIGTLVALPIEIYFELHEHAYGLSKYTPATFAFDTLKSIVIMTGALGALTFGLFGLARHLKHWWAVLGTVCALLLVFSAALDPFRARAFFDQKPLPAGELRDAITSLMAKAQIDFKDVVVEDNSHATVKLQAYFAGRGPTRTIVLNQSLLKELTTAEILAAVAHESGHVHESRWPATIASAIAFIAFLFLVDRVLRLVARRGWWGVTDNADIRALPLVMLVFGLCTWVAAPVSAAFSRERERAADRYGLELTSDPDAFASMLVKAARVNKMDPDPPLWVTLKGRTHPSIRERLDAIPAKTNGE